MQCADHRDRFLELLQPDVGLGPRVTEDVLVERLTAAHAEHEPAVQLHCGRRCRLRDHGGMDAVRGARDGGGDRQRGHLRQGADHRPHERALALFVVPRMEVIRDPQPLEPGRLGHCGLTHQLTGPELLTGQEVTEAHHVTRLPTLADFTGSCPKFAV